MPRVPSPRPSRADPGGPATAADARAADLAAWFGADAVPFLAWFRNPKGAPEFWLPAAALALVWPFWRRQWVLGSTLTCLPLLAAVLTQDVTLVLLSTLAAPLVCGAICRPNAVRAALTVADRLREAGVPTEERHRILARLGAPTLFGGLFGGLSWLAVVAIAVEAAAAPGAGAAEATREALGLRLPQDRMALAVVAMVPALALLAYVAARSGSGLFRAALWGSFALGAACAQPMVLLLEAWLGRVTLSGAAALHFEAYLLAGLPEEAAKFLVLTRFALNQPGVWRGGPPGDARRHLPGRTGDPVLMAVAVALGFAALENVLYVVAGPEWQSVALGRAMTAVPVHACLGMLMGAMVLAGERAGWSGDRGWSPGIWRALAVLLPAGLHGIYNLPLHGAAEVVGQSSDDLARIGLFGFLSFGALALVVVSGRTALNLSLAGEARAVGTRWTFAGAALASFGVYAALIPWLEGDVTDAGARAWRPWESAANGFAPVVFGLGILRRARRRD